MKKYMEPVGFILAIVMLIVLTGFTEKELNGLKYNSLRININTDEGNFFVTSAEVEEAVYHMGYVTGGVKMRNINIRSLEDFFDSYPYIAKSQVFSTIGGELIIEIKQRVPVLRIFQENNDSYYMDEKGLLMPVSEDFTSHVPVANGAINAPYNLYYGINYASLNDDEKKQKNKKLLHDLHVIITELRKDELWNAQFNQIYVDDKAEFELVPRVGNHTITLGNIEAIDKKLRKLKIFYFKGLEKTGWNEYRNINLKFENQVVCTKK